MAEKGLQLIPKVSSEDEETGDEHEIPGYGIGQRILLKSGKEPRNIHRYPAEYQWYAEQHQADAVAKPTDMLRRAAVLEQGDSFAFQIDISGFTHNRNRRQTEQFTGRQQPPGQGRGERSVQVQEAHHGKADHRHREAEPEQHYPGL